MSTIATVEIRLYPQQDEGYPLELTVNHEQQFERGYLSADSLPWVASGSPETDGRKLFDWLLADPVISYAWAEIRGHYPQRRLLWRIDAAAPELHTIPWELLREAAADGSAKFLAATDSTPFSRYLAGTWQAGQPILQRPLKMLALVANPENLADYQLNPIDVEAEIALLKAAIADSEVDLTVLEAATLPALEAELRKGYHLLHVVAHGLSNKKSGEAALLLSEANNQVDLVTDHRLAEMLARQLADSGPQPDDKLRLVFLAACQSATVSGQAFSGLAQAVVQAGVPAVLAMQDVVTVETARTFSQRFYERLLAHGQVDVASNEARSTLLTEQQAGAAIPVLFMRLREGQLFEFAPPESTAPASPASGVTIGAVGGDISGNIAGGDIHQEIHHHHYAAPPQSIGSHPPAIDPMTSLEPNLYRQLQETLLRCDVMQTHRSLKAIFVDSRLALWRNHLPEANSVFERVQTVIDIFTDKTDAAGDPALVLLLQVLQDQTPTGDHLHHELGQLVKDVQQVMARLRQAQVTLGESVESISPPAHLPFEPETILIPAGSFWMGDDGDSVASPRHQVTLPDYRIGKYPVTNEQYWEFVKDTGHTAPKVNWMGRKPRKNKLNHPVVEMSWHDAEAYCRWLRDKTGRHYRLPSEAEWEKAARGPDDSSIYPWGDDWIAERCNYDSGKTTSVEAYPSQNDYGCYDMVGNVREWTQTLWGSDLDETEFPYPWANDQREALETADQYSRAYRIYRGGSCDDEQSQLRCSARDWYALDIRNKYCGFRVVEEL